MSPPLRALAQEMPLVIFVGGFCDSLVKVMVRLHRECQFSHQVKVYYPHTMGKTIEEQIVYWKTKTTQPVVLIGHSYGADTSVRVVERLAAHHPGITVDLLITLDPVSRRGGVPRAPLRAAKRWLNARVDNPWKLWTISNLVALIGGHWPALLPLGLVAREHEVAPPYDHVSVRTMIEPFWDEVRTIK